jgi:hypothetical protein
MNGKLAMYLISDELFIIYFGLILSIDSWIAMKLYRAIASYFFTSFALLIDLSGAEKNSHIF